MRVAGLGTWVNETRKNRLCGIGGFTQVYCSGGRRTECDRLAMEHAMTRVEEAETGTTMDGRVLPWICWTAGVTLPDRGGGVGGTRRCLSCLSMWRPTWQLGR